LGATQCGSEVLSKDWRRMYRFKFTSKEKSIENKLKLRGF
jgi:hypothetical protein